MRCIFNPGRQGAWIVKRPNTKSGETESCWKYERLNIEQDYTCTAWMFKKRQKQSLSKCHILRNKCYRFVFNVDSILIQSRCWWTSLVSGTRLASSWKLAFAVIRTGPPDLLLRSSYLLSTFYVLVEVAGLNTCYCCYSNQTTCLALERYQA